MSYILDALKKADAQRERDPARGIHAQPASLATGPLQSGGGYRAWLWGASAAGLAVLAAVGWYLYRDQEEVAARNASSTAVAQAPVVVPAAAAIPVAQQPPPVATAVMPPPPPAVMAAREPLRDPRNTGQPMTRGQRQLAQAAPAASGASSGVAPAAPGAASSVAPAAAPAVAPGGNATRTAVATAASGPAHAPAAAAAVAPVPPRPPVTAQAPRAPVIAAPPPAVGLPPDAPKMLITGGVYSNNPAQRMLIVNGQVVSQGADLGSGVTLEEIKPKAAVLNFRGARYSVGY